MCKNFFYRFLHFKIFNLNQLLKNKIEPIEPKRDFTVKWLEKTHTKQKPNYNSEVSVALFTRTKIKSDFKSANSENVINQKNLHKTDQLVIVSARDQTNKYQCVNWNGNAINVIFSNKSKCDGRKELVS